MVGIDRQAFEAADQRGGGVKLEHPGGLGEIFVGHLQESLHLGAQPPFGVHQPARAVHQPLRLTDLLHPTPERRAEQADHAAEMSGRFILDPLQVGLRLVLFHGLRQFHVGGVDRDEASAVKRTQRGQHELVHRVGQEDHLDPSAAKDLIVGALPQRSQIGTAEIINELWFGRGAADVVVERRRRFRVFRERRREPEQLRHPVAIHRVARDPFLEDRAELAIEGQVFAGRLLGPLLERVENAFDQRVADPPDDRVVLQGLA